MFISLGSVLDSRRIWAKWGSPAEDVAAILFLHLGQDLTVTLTRDELLTLDLVIVEALEETPRSVAEVAEKTQQ